MVVFALILASQIPVLPKVEPAKTLGERRENFVNIFDGALTEDQDDDSYDLGFHDGSGESPSASILFPAGSALTVVFMLETPSRDRLVTCYELKDNRPVQRWQFKLEPGSSPSKSASTLPRRIELWAPGYRLPTAARTGASKTLDPVMPFAHYYIQGDGGVVSRYVQKDGSLSGDPDDAPVVNARGYPITHLERKYLNGLKRSRP
jgi:hypothetical protein